MKLITRIPCTFQSILALAFAFCIGCKNESAKDGNLKVDSTAAVAQPLAATTIAFEDSTFNFGKINQGEMVEHTFQFTNTGEHPLVINDARASCGCTIPEWTKEPVLPGKQGKITVKYNSAGREGAISKTVSVYANTEPSITNLNIAVEVIPGKDTMNSKNKI